MLVFAVSCAGALLGCSVYDSTLLPVAQQPGAVIASPDAQTEADSGSDAGATGSPEGGTIVDPDETQTLCGDGRVSGVEKCDIAIAKDKPGACPSECPELAKCAPRQLVDGNSCQASCQLLELVCKSGDDCCPGKCSADNDADCSPTCGDGIVQRSRGETCERMSEVPCKTKDADCDDGNACTLDKLSGSPDNCNADCTHDPITTTSNGDRCCPSGANANIDDDCTPMCGNGVREASEECDGGLGCDETCKLTLQPEQVRCLESAKDDCERCACKQCTTTELACRLGSDETANKQCSDVLTCSRNSNCLGTTCYCVTALCIVPGPCRNEINAAAGSTDPNVITERAADPKYPVGRSYTADQCRVMQCMDSCR